jgi:hypothetical protein
MTDVSLYIFRSKFEKTRIQMIDDIERLLLRPCGHREICFFDCADNFETPWIRSNIVHAHDLGVMPVELIAERRIRIGH